MAQEINQTKRFRFAKQITSADDGTTLDEFEVSGSFVFSLLNGTTIAGELQRKTAFGNWVKVTESTDSGTLDAANEFIVHGGGIFRVSVTTATGTWDCTVKEA